MSLNLGLSFLGLVKIGVQNFVRDTSEGAKTLIAPLSKYSPIVWSMSPSFHCWGALGFGTLCKME